MSWYVKIRAVAAPGVVIGSGLLADAFLSVSSAKERRPKSSSPAITQQLDAGADAASAARPKPRRKGSSLKHDADRVRRSQTIPRDYVE